MAAPWRCRRSAERRTLVHITSQDLHLMLNRSPKLVLIQVVIITTAILTVFIIAGRRVRLPGGTVSMVMRKFQKCGYKGLLDVGETEAIRDPSNGRAELGWKDD